MTNYTAYEVGRIYMGIKLHFTTDSYDYHKYNGQIKTYTPEAFEKRRDKYFFGKIARKYDAEEVENFFVANFVENPKAWVGEYLSDDCHNTYKRFLARLEQLSYLFEQDLLRLVDACHEAGTDLDGSVRGDNPLLLKLYYKKIVTPETVVILDRVFNDDMLWMWAGNVRDTVLWPKTKRFLLKFKPFIQVETPKYVGIVKKIVKNT